MASLIDLKDPLRAMVLLTRIPVGGADGARAAASAWAWPLVGLVVGGLAALMAWGAVALGLSSSVVAGLAILTMVLATGALHEDGFADCADGFWGGHDPARRLEIMKDSRIGAYGVLALIIGFALKWTLLTELIAGGWPWIAIVIPAIVSRAAMLWMMAALPFARDDGLARHVGQPPRTTVGIGIATAVILTVVLGGWAGAATILVAAAATLGMARLARAKIGGQTGDVLGATQYLTELAALLTLAVMLAP